MTTHATSTDLTGDKTVFGVWIYILSDCVLFAALFATYAVQHGQIFGGAAPGQIFNLSTTLAETLLLLTSSFTCGLAVLASQAGKKGMTQLALAATLALGLSFAGLELREFAQLLADGNSWQQSGFLSAFFTLVGTHGLHVTLGMLWMVVLMAHLALQGLTAGNRRKLMAFSIFWHFLDSIWIFIFTYVYLFGLL